MYCTNRIKLLLGLLLCLANVVGSAQPVFETRQEIEGITMYQDLMQKNKYYYVPADLGIAKNSDDSPKFKYLKMANSTLNQAGNMAQLKNLNLIQVSLTNPPTNKDKLLQIREVLGGENIQLMAMPIDKFEFALLAGIESAGRNNRLATHLDASFENSGSGLWENKAVTIRLSKAAAALVDQQMEDTGQLGIHFSYSYYTHFVIGIDKIRNEGQTALESLKKDTLLAKVAYKTAIFDLDIDLDRWGSDCIEEIVLNEEVLPRYLPLQVFCYDFSDDLRPDLLMKKIELCGDGLEGVKSCIQLEFSKQNRDRNAYSARFKRPVLLTNPLRYKVTEISTISGLEKGDWINLQPGESINITTAEQDQAFSNQEIEIEADFEEMRSLGLRKAKIELAYQINKQRNIKEISLNLDEDFSILTTNFFHDKDTPIHYTISWVDDQEALRSENTKTLDGDYLYLKP